MSFATRSPFVAGFEDLGLIKVAMQKWPCKSGHAKVDSGLSGFSARRMPRWPRDRMPDKQATSPEPQPGIQGEGSVFAVKGEKTLAELAQQFDVHPDQITS
jgi:hypothetical protein